MRVAFLVAPSRSFGQWNELGRKMGEKKDDLIHDNRLAIQPPMKAPRKEGGSEP